MEFVKEEYELSLKRIEESYKDKSYQNALSKYCKQLERIRESYSVLNNLNLLIGEKANELISLCIQNIELEAKIRTKREYYERCSFDYSEAYKYLCLIYDKQQKYENVATVCITAIRAGYVKDGTKGGMRGRLARTVKRGNLPITDEIAEALNI